MGVLVFILHCCYGINERDLTLLGLVRNRRGESVQTNGVVLKIS